MFENAEVDPCAVNDNNSPIFLGIIHTSVVEKQSGKDVPFDL